MVGAATVDGVAEVEIEHLPKDAPSAHTSESQSQPEIVLVLHSSLR